MQKLQIEPWPIGKIKPYERNTKKHPKDQVDKIARQITEHGFDVPIVVDAAGVIIKGHGRLMAAKHLKLKEVPVIVRADLSPEQVKASRIADNKVAESEWDDEFLKEEIKWLNDLKFDLTLTGFDDVSGFIDAEPPLMPQCDEDETPEVDDTPPVVKRGQTYQLGKHRLMCGDATSIDVDKLVAMGNISFIFTDPPYGMKAVEKSAVLSKRYRPIIGDDNPDVAKISASIMLALNVPTILWGANYYSSCLPDAACWIVWDKNNGGSDQTDAELAWTNLKGVVRQFTQASEKTNRVHPTQKPVSLIEWCFNKYEAGNHVLDLFGGSGSTLIACEKTNRKCFMMELDEKYCDVIVARWEKYTGKKAELLCD